MLRIIDFYGNLHLTSFYKVFSLKIVKDSANKQSNVSGIACSEFFEEYEILTDLGKGGFGFVKKAYDRETKELVSSLFKHNVYLCNNKEVQCAITNYFPHEICTCKVQK